MKEKIKKLQELADHPDTPKDVSQSLKSHIQALKSGGSGKAPKKKTDEQTAKASKKATKQKKDAEAKAAHREKFLKELTPDARVMSEAALARAKANKKAGVKDKEPDIDKRNQKVTADKKANIEAKTAQVKSHVKENDTERTQSDKKQTGDDMRVRPGKIKTGQSVTQKRALQGEGVARPDATKESTDAAAKEQADRKQVASHAKKLMTKEPSLDIGLPAKKDLKKSEEVEFTSNGQWNLSK